MKRKRVVLAISKFIQSLSHWLVKKHIIRPSVIVLVDGGICSQMRQYLYGQYIAESGVKVYYDLHWFAIGGKDTNGIYERPFELKTMCPYLPLREPSALVGWWYRHFMQLVDHGGIMPKKDEIRNSFYLNTYLEFPDDIWYSSAFEKYFPLRLLSEKHTLPIEANVHSCAVHIRRGDMSYVKFETYKNPIDYFTKAMKYVISKHKNVKFFLFSDEPNWVRKELSPLMKEMNTAVISGNIGHVDLILATQCGTIIASQGTMGRIAGLLNKEVELIIPPTGNWGAFHVEKYRDVKILYSSEPEL